MEKQKLGPRNVSYVGENCRTRAQALRVDLAQKVTNARVVLTNLVNTPFLPRFVEMEKWCRNQSIFRTLNWRSIKKALNLSLKQYRDYTKDVFQVLKPWPLCRGFGEITRKDARRINALEMDEPFWQLTRKTFHMHLEWFRIFQRRIVERILQIYGECAIWLIIQ